MADGINRNASEAIRAAAKMAADSLRAAKKELGIASPSKEFTDIGKNVDNSFADSVIANAYKIDRAMENVFGDMERAVNVRVNPNIAANAPSFREEATLALAGTSKAAGGNTYVTVQKVEIDASSVKDFNDVVSIMANLTSGQIAHGMAPMGV
jgi:hypothetical protein